MKTSTMLLLGAAGAVAYYMYKNQAPLTAATTGSSTVSPTVSPPFAATTLTHGASPPVATSMLAEAAPVDPTDPTNPPPDDYSDVSVPSYSWTPPAYGSRAWSGGGMKRGRKGRR